MTDKEIDPVKEALRQVKFAEKLDSNGETQRAILRAKLAQVFATLAIAVRINQKEE